MGRLLLVLAVVAGASLGVLLGPAPHQGEAHTAEDVMIEWMSSAQWGIPASRFCFGTSGWHGTGSWGADVIADDQGPCWGAGQGYGHVNAWAFSTGTTHKTLTLWARGATSDEPGCTWTWLASMDVHGTLHGNLVLYHTILNVQAETQYQIWAGPRPYGYKKSYVPPPAKMVTDAGCSTGWHVHQTMDPVSGWKNDSLQADQAYDLWDPFKFVHKWCYREGANPDNRGYCP